MNNHLLAAGAALITLAFASAAFAEDLNPQPEPPGVHRLTTTHLTTSTIGSATGGAGAGKVTTLGSATGGAGSGKVGYMRKAGGTQTNIITNPGVTHGFNPQPDPPGDTPTQVQGQIQQ